MKTIFNLLLLVMLPISLFSQTAKYKMLDVQDPLIGEWEWIVNDTTGIAAPLEDMDWKCFSFSAGTTQSFGALSYDENKGFACASYFIAFSNGEQITGTISSSCEGSTKGKKVSFTYSYDATIDQLKITVRGENFYYKRRK